MTTPKLHAHRSVLSRTSCSGCYSHPLGGEGTRPRKNIMRRLNLPIAVLAAMILSLSGLIAAAPAVAYDLGAVYKDCEVNGTLTKQYPRAELQAALNALPAQVSEYSACSDVIRQALLRASSSSSGGTHPNSKTLYSGTGRHGGGSSGGGKGAAGARGGNAGTVGSTSAKAGKVGSPGAPSAVNLAGSNVSPGSTGSSTATSSLPPALIVVLILLALTAVSGGAVAIRRRVVARHGT